MQRTLTVLTAVALVVVLFPFPLAGASGDQDGDGKITGPRLSGDTRFRGCFVSGPALDGSTDTEFDGDVETMTGGLAGTGSWQAGDQTKLKNGKRADIEDCVGKAKADSQPGDEFIFYFAGHGGDSHFPDAAEADESAGSDNHIRIGNTAGGAADRMTDDQLAQLLSGFKFSVTIVVVLDSCYSHTFYDGANDLKSVTEKDGGNDVPTTDHLALLAATTAAEPECSGGFTKKLVEGLTPSKADGKAPADKNKDGTVTAKELSDHAGGYLGAGKSRCDDPNCVPASPGGTHSSTFRGAAPPLVDNCPETYNPDQRDVNGDGIGDDCVIRTYEVGVVGDATQWSPVGGAYDLFGDGSLDLGGVVYTPGDPDVPTSASYFAVVSVDDAASGSHAVGGWVCVEDSAANRECSRFEGGSSWYVGLHAWSQVIVFLDGPAVYGVSGGGPPTVRGDVVGSFW